MKKIILALVVLTTTFYVSDAQIRFGLKAGASFYNFGGDDAEDLDLDSKISFNAGGMVNIPISENFSFNPEVIFNGEGAKMEEGDDRVNYNLGYINVPLLLQFNSTSGFYAEFGPQVGFLMSAKYDFKIGGVEGDEDIKESFKGTNFSVALGAGYRMSNGFGIGARYNLGLSNIADEDDADLKTRGFQVGVSFLFGGSGGEAKKK